MHHPLELLAVLQRVGKPVFNVEFPDSIHVDFDGGWLDSVGEVCGDQHLRVSSEAGMGCHLGAVIDSVQ